MVGLDVLRMPTLDDPEEITRHERLIEQHYPRVSTLSRCIPSRPDGIPNAATKVNVLPYIGALGREVMTEVDVLCISYALDPDVETLDEALNVPVVDADASVAAVTSAHGERVGTFGFENGAEPVIRDPPDDWLTTEEVAKDAATTNHLTTGESRTAICATVSHFVDAGCGIVAPNCTGISLSGTIPGAWADTPIPIADSAVAMDVAVTTTVAPPRPPRQQVTGSPRWHSIPLTPRSRSHA